MMQSLPLLLIGLPLVGALVTSLLGRWPKVLVSAGILFAGASWLVSQSWGRLNPQMAPTLAIGDLTLTATNRGVALIGGLTLTVALWLTLSAFWRLKRPFGVPALLMTLTLLTSMLLVDDPALSISFWLLGMGGLLLVLVGEQTRHGGTLLRILLPTTAVSAALLLLSSGLFSSSDSATILLGKWPLLAGSLLILAGFPLFFWFPALVQRLVPMSLLLFVGLYGLASGGLLFNWFLAAAWVWQDEQVVTLLIWSGAATVLLAGLLALLSNDLSRLPAFLLLLNVGLTLPALALMDGSGWQTAVSLHITRVVSLLLLLVGASALPAAHLNQSAQLLRKRPFAAGLYLFGLFSLVGLPLTIGFPSLWLLITAILATPSAPWWLPMLLLLGVGLAALAVVRWLVLQLRPTDVSLANGTPTGRWQPVLLVSVGLALLTTAFPRLLFTAVSWLTGLS